jgi:hypothetical protein
MLVGVPDDEDPLGDGSALFLKKLMNGKNYEKLMEKMNECKN